MKRFQTMQRLQRFCSIVDCDETKSFISRHKKVMKYADAKTQMYAII